MGRWVDTIGKSLVAIGVCDRCHQKFPLVDLLQDPNSPGLRVCYKDRDVFDPWRLPARIPERINLPFVRPDVDLAVPVAVAIEDYRITEDGDTRITEDGNTRVI